MKRLGLVAASAALLVSSSFSQTPENKGEVYGTVVSLRGNILQMRPSLRPKLTRVSFGDTTEILARRSVDRTFLKPGMRFFMVGPYSAETKSISPFFIEAAKDPLGHLKDKSEGIVTEDGGWARASGTIKSVEPFAFTDDNGKEYTADLMRVRRYFELYRGDRNGLLIGTRLEAVGPISPDGVMQATTIIPDRDFSAVGTMFGTILSVKGKTLTVRPRYTQDKIEVVLKDGCTLQREVAVDPETVKVGATVTFWGQRGNNPDDKNELLPVALLLGDGRYPAATEGDEAAKFYTGKLTSLDPVRFTATSGERLDVVIPAQMAIARLTPIKLSDLKSGAQAMLVLERADGDRFICGHVIVDASPWVGYGG